MFPREISKAVNQDENYNFVVEINLLVEIQDSSTYVYRNSMSKKNRGIISFLVLYIF